MCTRGTVNLKQNVVIKCLLASLLPNLFLNTQLAECVQREERRCSKNSDYSHCGNSDRFLSIATDNSLFKRDYFKSVLAFFKVVSLVVSIIVVFFSIFICV